MQLSNAAFVLLHTKLKLIRYPYAWKFYLRTNKKTTLANAKKEIGKKQITDNNKNVDIDSALYIFIDGKTFSDIFRFNVFFPFDRVFFTLFDFVYFVCYLWPKTSDANTLCMYIVHTQLYLYWKLAKWLMGYIHHHRKIFDTQ